MLTAWIFYSIAVSLLVALAARVAEGAVRSLGGPTRWVWPGAILAAGALMSVPAVLPRVGGASGGAGGIEVGLGPITLLAAGDAAASGSGWFLSMLRIPADSWLTSLDLPVALLWLVATALLAARLAGAARRLRGRMSEWKHAELDGHTVLLSRDTGPAVVGLGRDEIVVPTWILSVEPPVRSLILQHEEEHRRAGDPRLVLAGTAAVVLFPWNLPFWWILERMRAAIETDCDERVLRSRPGERRRYGTLLIDLGHRGRPLELPAPAFAGRKPLSLQRRIEMLVRTPPKHPVRRATLLTGAAVVLVVGACLVPTPGEDEAGIVDPDARTLSVEREAETADRAGDRAASRDLSEAPDFTPFTQAPEVRNRGELAELLEREYPALLRDAGIGGTTIVHFFIRDDGTLGNVLVAEGSGHDALDQAALRVAQRFEFSAAYNRDEPTPVWIQIPITFTTN